MSEGEEKKRMELQQKKKPMCKNMSQNKKILALGVEQGIGEVVALLQKGMGWIKMVI
jgi:hypothetical protein